MCCAGVTVLRDTDSPLDIRQAGILDAAETDGVRNIEEIFKESVFVGMR